MPNCRLFPWISVVLAAYWWAPTSADARTIGVPSDHSTLQAGIDAASVGDTVLVAPGTYTGLGNKNLDFGGTDLVLLSEAGAEATVIDCEGEGRGLLFQSGETRAAVLDGFTITHGGPGAPWPAHGGGIACYQASPTITHCIVSKNNHPGWFGGGGGMTVMESSALVTHCTIIGNEYEGSPGSGGGVSILYSTSDPLFVNCTIAENVASLFGGGGFYVASGASATFVDCRITGNRSLSHGGGAYLGSFGEPGIALVNCQISHNTVVFWGGGIHRNSGDVTLMNCTIAGNAVDDNYRQGAGISSSSVVEARLELTNSVVWGNVPDAIWGDPTVSYSNIEGGYEGERNIDAAPLFADAANDDYHLSDGSPCIDTGTAEGAPDTDFEGDVRPIGDGVDMGVDEHGGGGAPCDLEVGLSGYPEAVLRGDYLTFDAMVANTCDDPLAFDRALMNITGPASLEKALYDGDPFPVVDSVATNLSLAVPPRAPLGTYTVEVTIFRDGETIHSDAFEVDVSG